MSTAQSADQRTHQYWVKFEDDLRLAKVKLCFDGKAPEYLAVDYRKATKNLIKFPEADKGFIEFYGRYWNTSGLGSDACVEYTSDITEHLIKSKKNNSPKLSFQRDNSWLWLPETYAKKERSVVHFSLPSQYQISVPWKRISDTSQSFEVGKSPHDWGFTLVVGEFEQKEILLADDSIVEISHMNTMNNAQAISLWVKDIAQSVGNYLGRFPVSKVQVLLIENPRFKNGPVPWGEVNRGGGAGVRFVIDSSQPIENFYDDWTASHEFAHLLMPKIKYKDAWLSEGLASYLQYLLMAQSRQISAETAWKNLYQGLRRGEKGTKKLKNESLQETIANRGHSGSWRSGRTMRIYWTGAAYFLIADWQLRKHSQGEVGLNKVLKRFNDCCNRHPKAWGGAEFANKMDELSNTDIFSRLYEEITVNKQFPDYRAALAGLGINTQEGRLQFANDKSALLRQQIESH